MRAITIAPATAACILDHGQNVINKTYQFPRRLINKPIALHTSQGFPQDVLDIYRNHGFKVEPMPSGCVVAIARVIGCPRKTNSIWAKQGLFHWQIELTDLVEAIVLDGGDGLWELTEPQAKYVNAKRKALKVLTAVP